MAIVAVPINLTNPIPVNGTYTFKINFYNSVTNQLLTDVRFPQDQIIVLNSISTPQIIEAEVADGSYIIDNVGVRVTYKNQIINTIVGQISIACLTPCVGFPISNVVVTNPNSLTITLSGNTTQNYGWKIYNASNSIVQSGAANTSNSNTFTAAINQLPAGTYLFEVNSFQCTGKSSKIFSVATSLPNCDRGPTPLYFVENGITPTQLKVQYDGQGIYRILWQILQGSSIIRTGELVHTSQAQTGDATFNSSLLTINYAQIPYGDYTLTLKGVNCNSAANPLGFSLVDTTPSFTFTNGYPSVSGSAGNYSMSVAVNLAGTYNFVILNSTTGAYYRNANTVFTANTPIVTTGLPVGSYVVQVGSLTTTLNISNTGTTPCSYGPLINNIMSASSTSIQIKYDAVAVTSFKWRIKLDGNVIRNGIGYPTNNEPIITFSAITDGTYVLEIEGDNCSSSIDAKTFTLSTTAPTSNAGLRETNVGGKKYLVRDSINFKASVNPTNGNVTLDYPELKTSQGGKQIKGYLLNEYEALVEDSEKNSLRSGTQLREGHYHFFLRYAATDTISNWSQAKGNMWPLFLNPDTKFINGDRVETVVIEVISNLTI